MPGFELGYLVEEQHEVDAEGDGQSDELHGEEVPSEEADNSFGVGAEVDGGERGWLHLGGLGLGQLLHGCHGGQLTSAQVLLLVGADEYLRLFLKSK